MGGLTVSIKDNRIKWDIMLKNVAGLAKKPVVAVGLPENKSPSAVVAYASYNHFGTARIPARPFIAVAVDQNKEKIFNLKKKLLSQIIIGQMTIQKGLGFLGQFLTGEIKKVISGGFFKETIPNKPSTIKQKGSSKPLIDHGTMKNSITYEVRLNGKRSN